MMNKPHCVKLGIQWKWTPNSQEKHTNPLLCGGDIAFTCFSIHNL